MNVWYNENDPKIATWLRELIRCRFLPEGDIDDRSIEAVEVVNCAPTSHFFAGIGGWPLALYLAGWSAGKPVWTGSCPCQPFSVAGKRLGTADKRHLWPVWLRLIRECHPPTIFGEQVASRLGREWLAGVRADLEALGYAVGAADLCAAGVGAPHIRQRLFWVAVSNGGITSDGGLQRGGRYLQQPQDEAAHGLGNTTGSGKRNLLRGGTQAGNAPCGQSAPDGRLGDPNAARFQERSQSEGRDSMGNKGSPAGAAGTLDGAWTAYDLIPCADGKSRRVEPGTFPLAHGVPARVGRLRGYGNAIVPQIAAAFVRAVMETLL